MIRVKVDMLKGSFIIDKEYNPNDSFSAVARQVVETLGHTRFSFFVKGANDTNYVISPNDMYLKNYEKDITFAFIQRQECVKMKNGVIWHEPVSNWLHFEVKL